MRQSDRDRPGRSGGPSWHWSAAPAECRRRSSPRLQSLELWPRVRLTRLSLQSCYCEFLHATLTTIPGYIKMGVDGAQSANAGVQTTAKRIDDLAKQPAPPTAVGETMCSMRSVKQIMQQSSKPTRI